MIFYLYENWIIWIFIASEFIGRILSHTVIIEKPRSTITIGPCTWVIDRKCPDNDIEFYLFTRRNQHDRQLIHIDETWEKSNLSLSYFNPSHPVKIIIHGYNSDMFIHPLIQMKDEYFKRGNYNLLYIDWSKLAIGPCYLSAVHNARHVGACIAQLVERILEAGTANIHVIGFSLGAQVTNFIARNLGSFLLPRITGLDPAMPLFITSSTDNKLDPSDAAFVDVIHTNALVQGKIERCGHVDFYMNGGIIQPGCFSHHENVFACSHHRAPDYFSESIRSYKGFWGWACSSYINYLFGLCPRTNYLVLAGEDCRSDTEGMFLITTNDESPFAKGKWTEQEIDDNNHIVSTSFAKADPLQKEIDQWGKLDGSFNNIKNFPTPFSQDPNGGNYPYFGWLGTKEITEIADNDNTEEINHKQKRVNSRLSLHKNTHRIRTTTIKPRINSLMQQHNVITSRKQLLQEYKRNLTKGVLNIEIFQIPTLNLED